MDADELLVKASQMMDLREKVLESEIQKIRLSMENNYLPRLQTIESVYTSTYERYVGELEKQEQIITDIDVIKTVLMHHSDQLDTINRTLNEHSKRFDRLEARFDGLEERFDGMEKMFGGLTDIVVKNSEQIGMMAADIQKLTGMVERLS